MSVNNMIIGTTSIDAIYVGSIEVDSVYLGETLVYSGGTPPIDYRTVPLTIEAVGSDDLQLTAGSGYTGGTYSGQYTINDGTPTQFSVTSGAGLSITGLSQGDKVKFEVTSNQVIASNSYSGNRCMHFQSTGTINAYGNIMSMMFVDFANTNDYGSNKLGGFFGGSKVVDASNLWLCNADTIWGDYMWEEMFMEDTYLTSAPALPATAVTIACYYSFFDTCTSLTTAPELPATTLVDRCYQAMFFGCSSLTTAPELPATTLAYQSYQAMFKGCSSLTTAPELPATTLASTCYHNMFQNCTSLTEAPVLPAATLVNACYQNMFNGCSSLSAITCLATSITATSCTSNWVYGVASAGTFTKVWGTTWSTGVNGIPSGWTVPSREVPFTIEVLGDNETLELIMPSSGAGSYEGQYSVNGAAPVSFSLISGDTLSITGLSSGDTVAFTLDEPCDWMGGGFNTTGGTFNAYGNILSLVYAESVFDSQTIIDAFRELFVNSNIVDASNLWLGDENCEFEYQDAYRGMFSGCTGLTSAPALNVTTLNSRCYQEMFAGCTSLTSAPALPSTSLASASYRGMFSGCTSLTSAPALPSTALTYSCYREMFAGCTSLTEAPMLPAETLTSYGYNTMFSGCSSLSAITCYAVDKSAFNCTDNWVSGVSSTGLFQKASGATWSTDNNGIPSGWTVQEVSPNS